MKRVSGKLSNENFTAKAPEDVVTKEREKEAALSSRIDALKDQREKLDGL